MPRIRSLNPDIWSDEALGACTPLAILVFVGLITQADDEGRLRAHPVLLKTHLFPYSEKVTVPDIGQALDELSSAQLVQLYEVGGHRFAALRSWRKHQRIDRPSPSKLPAPHGVETAEIRRTIDEPSESPRRTIDDASTTPRPGEEGKGEERIGREGKGDTAARAARPLRPAEYPLPPALDVPAFRGAWAVWHAYRRERKLPEWKSRTIVAKLTECARFGPTVAVAAIEAAIGNGWAGFFPEKQSRRGGAADRSGAWDIPSDPAEELARNVLQAEEDGATAAELEQLRAETDVGRSNRLYVEILDRLSKERKGRKSA